jgi:hypothetical protein
LLDRGNKEVLEPAEVSVIMDWTVAALHARGMPRE